MESGFSLSVSQNRYLSTEDDEMDAVLTVSAQGAVGGGAAPEVAQVIVIDCSGSMSRTRRWWPRNGRRTRRSTRCATGRCSR